MKIHTRSFIEALDKVGLCYRSGPIRGAEIGVWRGENSAELLRYYPSLFLYMVDRYQQLTEQEAKVHRRTGQLSQKEMDRVWQGALKLTEFADGRRKMLIMSSQEASNRIGDEDLDFVFIDASHDYDSVRADILAWDPKIKTGGIIGGHDYNGRGDRKGRFGVKKAVDEIYGDRVNVSPGLVWWVQI